MDRDTYDKIVWQRHFIAWERQCVRSVVHGLVEVLNKLLDTCDHKYPEGHSALSIWGVCEICQRETVTHPVLIKIGPADREKAGELVAINIDDYRRLKDQRGIQETKRISLLGT